MLISTKPDTKGKEAALFRSRQLTECDWTPIRDIPTFIRPDGKTVFPAGKPLHGMIYSSPEAVDKFIGENVSFETFLTTLANPDSVLYNKDLGGRNNSWAYYGIVCNGLARYALNIRRRFSTKRWLTLPGMRIVGEPGKYTAEDIQLCDVIWNAEPGLGHVALITDILRDENGTIQQIEVSEAIRPVCVRRQHNVADYFEKYKIYHLMRYDEVDNTPMPDMEQDAILRNGLKSAPVIALDCGNKSNYRSCEDITISAFADGEVEIRRGAECVKTLMLTAGSKFTCQLDRGYYTVTHKPSGETLEFCVTQPQIIYSVKDGKLTVYVDPRDEDSKILYMDFRQKSNATYAKTPDCSSLEKLEELTDEEKRTGIITREIPEDGKNFKVYFENKYGIYTHTMLPV